MNKRFVRKWSSLLLAGWLLMSPVILTAQAVSAEPETITISSEADLLAFVKNCTLDTWSQGKTVVLTVDLDLAGAEFSPIPTFGGTFQGHGHTISGLRITADGSIQGLFRYLQPGGVIQDLTVKGTVSPGGTRSTVGGIVGDNSGTVQNCAFHGTVQGDSMVGGIAGRSNASGEIIGCTVSGSVSGTSATGGIAGRNSGLLLKCENSAGVNLTQTEAPVDLTDMDAGTVLEERAAADDDTYHLLSGCSDTGGIVGWSGGVVQSCVNNGAVGYPHVGYNTGGIAGRQSGYLAGCVNNGTINGRKDVGGIVGQAEPFLLIDPREDSLERLRDELDALDRLIDRAIDDAQRTGDDISALLGSMGGFTDDARDSSQQMLDHITDFADDNIGSVNTLMADLTNALDKMTPALDDLSSVGGKLEELSAQLRSAMDSLSGSASAGDLVMAELQAAADRLQAAGGQLKKAADALGDALEELAKALPEIKEGEEDGDLSDALEEVEQKAVQLVSAVGEAAAAVDQVYAAFDLPDLDLPEVPEVPELPEFDWDAVDFEKVRDDLEAISDALKPAGDDLTAALDRLSQALKDTDGISAGLKDALEHFKKVSDSSAAIGRLAGRAFDAINGAVKDLTAKGPVSFTPLGDRFRQASDNLFDALGGLSGEMDALNRTAQSGNDTLSADLRAINDQFHTVLTVLLDSVADLTNTPADSLDPVIQDTSEEDIAATRDGKVADCRNTGAVEGDRNVGGVIGAMAIEFDLDPEDDATDMFSFGATYETKAVLQSCVNYGGVTAKKDCVGGLAGRMDLGTALDCQSYGPVESTGGDYVGGIAGFADASVRSCWAKNTLSGRNYMGGIAGWASSLRDCRSIVTIAQGAECVGAIAGGVERDGVLSGCCFVDTGTAGVDGVSYAGRAEPVAFDVMSQLESVPIDFTAFTLTLKAGDKTVAQIPFLYGDDLSRIELPAVPEQEGHYGVWPGFDTSGTRSDLTLEAVYAPWITLAASVEQSGKLSLALAEGRFTDEVVLHVSDSVLTPPKNNTEGAVTWDISLTGSSLTEDDMVPLRLLSPNGGDAAVWQYQNGQWVAVEAVLSGQYLLLSMEGTQGTFFIQPQDTGPWMTVLLAGAAVLGAALILLIGRRARQKRMAARPVPDPHVAQTALTFTSQCRALQSVQIYSSRP